MMPTAMRIAALRLLDPLCKAVYDLSSSFEAKEKEFAKISRGRSEHICMTQSPCPSALSLGPTALTSVERRTGFLPKKSFSPKYHWRPGSVPQPIKKAGPGARHSREKNQHLRLCLFYRRSGIDTLRYHCRPRLRAGFADPINRGRLQDLPILSRHAEQGLIRF